MRTLDKVSPTPRPLTLPKPSTTHLASAPLELVVCQIQHDRALGASAPGRALEVRAWLSKAFGEKLLIEENGQQEIAFSAVSGQPTPFPIHTEQVKGWRLRTRDGGWIAVIMPDFFALECTGYTTWTAFKTRLGALVDVALGDDEPTIEKRLGLRYVDRLTQPAAREVHEWGGRISDYLAGPILSPEFGPSVIGAQQVLQLAADNSLEVLLRHGPQRSPEGNWHYILDTDCYRSETAELTADSVMSGAEQLHKLALQVFQSSLTPQFLKSLRGGDRDDGPHD